MIQDHGLTYHQSFGSNQFMVFLGSGDMYGKDLEFSNPTTRFEDSNHVLRRSPLCFPRSAGDLIVTRQLYFFHFINSLVEVVLEMHNEVEGRKAKSKRESSAVANASISKLSLESSQQKLSLPEVIAKATEQKESLEEYLDLLRTEPNVLNYVVSFTFYSRPELVADERGRLLPMLTDEYISVALFDTINNAVRAIVGWDYISRLLQLVYELSDKVKRAVVMQELSNACDLEYRRAQAAFKRQMWHFSSIASKQFRRVSTAQDNATSRVVMKCQPSDWTVSNPQLHYVLRLCHADTSAKDAADWFRRLDDHNARYADDRNKMSADQVTALGDLAVIVSFIHAMSTTISLMAISRKKGQLFVSRSNGLETELNQQKTQADFGDFVAPLENIVQPGVATAVLKALDEFGIDKTGATLGGLYQDMLENSLADLEALYLQAKANTEGTAKSPNAAVMAQSATQPLGIVVQRRKEKEKTRPVARAYNITAPPSEQPPTPEVPASKLKVKRLTAELFRRLLSRSEARGSIAWTDLEAALVDLGFSVTLKGGSVFTYKPPESIGTKPLTLHYPHKSDLEGYKLLIVANRFRKRYDWTDETFEVS